jgi:DNA polymerase III alpha subunit (gram-positive type)
MVRFNRPALPPEWAERLQAWLAEPAVSLHQAHYQTRYVVLAISVRGLDPEADGALVSLAALGLTQGRITTQDAFCLDARRASPGDWLDFLDFAGKSPWVAHGVPFVAPFLETALRRALGFEARPTWLDLASLLSELFRDGPPPGARAAAWAAHFGLALPEAGADPAVVDALTLARLLQRLLAAARARGLEQPADLVELARARQWLRGDR